MTIQERIKKIAAETAAIYLAMKRPETPWYAKAIGGLTVAYALSPIDLIPDFIPVLGYLDDLIILPILIYLCVKLIPKEVMAKCREESTGMWETIRKGKWFYAIPVILIWGFILYLIIRAILNSL